MTEFKNTWTAEESEEVLNYIQNGDDVDVAKAKMMINKNEKLGELAAELYKNNNSDDKVNYDLISVKKEMINVYGIDNFMMYKAASKKNKIAALVYGKKNPKIGFQRKKSTGCYGIEG